MRNLSHTGHGLMPVLALPQLSLAHSCLVLRGGGTAGARQNGVRGYSHQLVCGAVRDVTAHGGSRVGAHNDAVIKGNGHQCRSEIDFCCGMTATTTTRRPEQ